MYTGKLQRETLAYCISLHFFFLNHKTPRFACGASPGTNVSFSTPPMLSSDRATCYFPNVTHGFQQRRLCTSLPLPRRRFHGRLNYWPQLLTLLCFAMWFFNSPTRGKIFSPIPDFGFAQMTCFGKRMLAEPWEDLRQTDQMWNWPGPRQRRAQPSRAARPGQPRSANLRPTRRHMMRLGDVQCSITVTLANWPTFP